MAESQNASSEHQFQVDYAKSGRARCKSCKEIIPAGMLRIATLSRSYTFDGTMAQWYHIKCFFNESSKRINYPRKPEEVKDLQELRPEDQDNVNQLITQFREKGYDAGNNGKQPKEEKQHKKSIATEKVIQTKQIAGGANSKSLGIFSESSRDKVKNRHPKLQEAEVAAELGKQRPNVRNKGQEKKLHGAANEKQLVDNRSRKRAGKAIKN